MIGISRECRHSTLCAGRCWLDIAAVLYLFPSCYSWLPRHSRTRLMWSRVGRHGSDEKRHDSPRHSTLDDNATTTMSSKKPACDVPVGPLPYMYLDDNAVLMSLPPHQLHAACHVQHLAPKPDVFHCRVNTEPPIMMNATRKTRSIRGSRYNLPSSGVSPHRSGRQAFALASAYRLLAARFFHGIFAALAVLAAFARVLSRLTPKPVKSSL